MKRVLFCLFLCVLAFYSCDTSLDDMIVDYNGGDINKGTTQNSNTGTKAVSTLKELKNAIADKTVSVIKLTSNIAINSTDDIKIGRSLTIDGDRYAIQGASFRVTDASANVIIQNVYFDGVATPDSGDDDKSIFYATANHKGNITIKGCTFDSTHWDAIQITPDTGANIVIDGNTFKETCSTSSLSNNKLRHIHIEADCDKGGKGKGVKRKGLTVAITNNVFRNCKKMTNAIIDVDYIDDSCLTASGNTFDESGLAKNNNEGERICIYPDKTSKWKCSKAYAFFTKEE